MKNSFKLKALCAALAVSAASAASASQIYLDVGQDFGGSLANKVCATCTGVKNEILYKYDSTTIVVDSNNSGSMDLGDLVTTTIGLAVPGVTKETSYVTGFNPGGSGNNGYNQEDSFGDVSWVLSMASSGLSGAVTGNGAGGIPLISYFAGGVIDMLLSVRGVNGGAFTNFMDLVLTSGSATGLSTALFGVPDFGNVNLSVYNNLIHSANGVTCGGATGFKQLADCTPNVPMAFTSTQDTFVQLTQFQKVGNTWVISSNHNGSMVFTVPEPTTLFLMGGALLGLGLSSRRRVKQN